MAHSSDQISSRVITGFKIKSKLCDSPPHVLSIATRDSDGKQVVIKTLSARYPSKKDVVALEREYRIINGLSPKHSVNVIDLISYDQGNVAMIMERFGCTLAEYRSRYEDGRIPLAEFFRIAEALVDNCGAIHDQGIVHKALEPRNILIDTSKPEVRFIDFGSSSELRREHQDTAGLSTISESALPYISPEQTGRINRDVDYRSDYYTIGATLYELVTGRLPYTAHDALEWIYQVISVQPTAPHAIDHAIPASLSAVIMKLLAKNAEDRYQSSSGIIADLKICEELWLSGKDDQDIVLGTHDRSHEFHVPQHLYGRESEVALLEQLFSRAASGSVEYCLVSGYSGIGKTSLVQELGNSIVARKGYLITGKFDQYRQNAAYNAITQAFGSLIRQILGEPKSRLEEWARRLQSALQGNARVIIDIIPELELILGDQPPVQELPPAESLQRFQLTFAHFIGVFANQDHPLVVFLDDLQWSDVPTLHLLTKLATAHELGYLMLIGAYRDNEVEVTHPLTLTLRDIRSKRTVSEINLAPMSVAATNALVSAALLCDPEDTKELCSAIYEKTAGNPFFTIELMKTLHARGAITHSAHTGRWSWDLDAVRSSGVTDNVIDILIDQQNKLPSDTRAALQLAACIGATFDLQTLSLISERALSQSNDDLKEASKAQLVIPLDDSYKFVADEGSRTIPSYRFQHDRIQQAAYSLIDASRRSHVHLFIGRLMLEHLTEEELEDRILEVVGHLNLGRHLVDSPTERERIASLNLMAGVKAMQSSAYTSSLSHLRIGSSLLGDDQWTSNRDLAWSITSHMQHCYYLTGDWNSADHYSEELFRHANNELEQVGVLSNRTRQYATTGRMKESIQAATHGLSILGFEFNSNPSWEDVAAERALIDRNLADRPIQSLIDLPVISDVKAQIASQLIMEIFPAAFLSASGELFPYLVMKSANVALVYGSSPESAFAYVAVGMILCGFYHETTIGFEFGKLGVDLIDRFNDISLRSRIIYVYTMFVHHWREHWSSMTPWFKRGIEAGYRSGDLLYLAYSAQDCVIWDPTLDLESATSEHREMLAIVKECEYRDSLDSGTLFLQMLLNFQGLTRDLYSMSDDVFDEEQVLAGMRSRLFMTGISNYHIYKAEIHLLYNDAAGALAHVLVQEGQMNSVIALPQSVRFEIVAFLTRSTLLYSSTEVERPALLERMIKNRDRMAAWADNCEQNFQHLLDLMDAELAGHEGRFRESLDLFERSINGAKRNGFRRDEAMANERAAAFLMRCGVMKAADGYLRDAQYLYYRWGARRKVEQMQSVYDLPRIEMQAEGMLEPDRLDINSVLKASQLISGELVLDRLLQSTLEVLMENAGAQTGYIVEQRDGQLHIQSAQSSSTQSDVHLREIPTSLINMAIRTSEPVVIDDAVDSNPFSNDPYFRTRHPLSILCVPLPSSGRIGTAVYLENDIIRSAFTKDRVEVIKLLASQASISMENARIYELQDRLLKAQQRFVPSQFLGHLGHTDIAKVRLGESVAMEMSVLFADIRNFTPLVERLTPQEVIQFLNDLYGRIGEEITSGGGFIDSYAGDGIVALFAVPALQAVSASIGISHALRRFNAEQLGSGGNPIQMGLGINTGPLVLGTMGGNERMQCSVLGDTVNLAARVEKLTRLYNSQLLIGESTVRALPDSHQFSLRRVDCVAVKGKNAAIYLYEVLDAECDERRALKESTRDLLHQALAEYQSRNFQVAETTVDQALAIDPSDDTLKILKSRIVRYIASPPPDDWQGFERLEHK